MNIGHFKPTYSHTRDAAAATLYIQAVPSVQVSLSMNLAQSIISVPLSQSFSHWVIKPLLHHSTWLLSPSRSQPEYKLVFFCVIRTINCSSWWSHNVWVQLRCTLATFDFLFPDHTSSFTRQQTIHAMPPESIKWVGTLC